jgi:hypothetical protein
MNLNKAPTTLKGRRNMTEAIQVLKIGDLDDGGVYVGLSASTGKPLHAALADEPEYMTYEEAVAAAEKLKALHPTAHVPTQKELNGNLFVNRFTGPLRGTFNTSGSDPDSCYRSSTRGDNYSKVQYFDCDDWQVDDFDHTKTRLPVRLVW